MNKFYLTRQLGLILMNTILVAYIIYTSVEPNITIVPLAIALYNWSYSVIIYDKMKKTNYLLTEDYVHELDFN